MSEDGANILDEALQAWGFARSGTIAEADNVPDARWDFRPHEKSKTYAELVRHMIEASHMLIGEAADLDGASSAEPPPNTFAPTAASYPPR